jgi:hypothetical protein
MQPARTWGLLRTALLPALVLATALLGCIVLPVVPIFVGVFLIVVAALYGFSAELRPYVQPALRTLLGGTGTGALLLTAGIGGVLVVSGSMGATLRGQWRNEWVQRDKRNEFADASVTALLERAKSHLSKGDVRGAEFALLGVDAIVDVAPEKRREVDELLERIHRSGDGIAILELLIELPQEEFEAFETGAAVPEALEFEERALSYRAVEVARMKLDEARRARAPLGVQSKDGVLAR